MELPALLSMWRPPLALQETRHVDYDSNRITENTRASYPIEHIGEPSSPLPASGPRHIGQRLSWFPIHLHDLSCFFFVFSCTYMGLPLLPVRLCGRFGVCPPGFSQPRKAPGALAFAPAKCHAKCPRPPCLCSAENAKIPCVGGHPKNIIMLCCDAFGVLPPVAKLTKEQAMYYFIRCVGLGNRGGWV